MRKKWAAANWKMHKNPVQAEAFFNEIQSRSINLERSIFFPSTVLIPYCLNSFKSKILWGAQNCHFETQGAFTGETSPETLSTLGAFSTLVGHSERRALFRETDEELSKKVRSLQDQGITPMLCVGETLDEREANKTNEVISQQLEKGLSKRKENSDFIIAYEPVWAIGTGKVASPEIAQEAHFILREKLKSLIGSETSEKTSILYGGSVKPENCNSLIEQKDIDGFLVGGASLNVDTFVPIIESTLD